MGDLHFLLKNSTFSKQFTVPIWPMSPCWIWAKGKMSVMGMVWTPLDLQGTDIRHSAYYALGVFVLFPIDELPFSPPKAFIPLLYFVLECAELLLCYYCSSRNNWWETRDTGDWVLCGGRAWGEHQGWHMLLCSGSHQLQPQMSGWSLREDGHAGPSWTCQCSLSWV